MTPQQKALQDCAQTLHDIAHGLESSRIWNGMGWTYNPLHSFKYLPLVEKARESAAQAKQALAEVQAQGEAVAWQIRHPNIRGGVWYEVDIDRFDGATPDFDKRALYAHPQASEPAEDFCDANCTWLDHQPGCVRHDKPAAPEATASEPEANSYDLAIRADNGGQP